jgi:hypothetical protein
LATFPQAVSFEPGAAPDHTNIRELFTLDGLLINNSGELLPKTLNLRTRRAWRLER